jgi:hypothetical protein
VRRLGTILQHIRPSVLLDSTIPSNGRLHQVYHRRQTIAAVIFLAVQNQKVIGVFYLLALLVNYEARLMSLCSSGSCSSTLFPTTESTYIYNI